MSLGSEHPETYDEALHESLARLIVMSTPIWKWRLKSQEEVEEDVIYSLGQLGAPMKGADDHGDRLIYDFLVAHHENAHDVLERFFDKLRERG